MCYFFNYSVWFSLIYGGSYVINIYCDIKLFSDIMLMRYSYIFVLFVIIEVIENIWDSKMLNDCILNMFFGFLIVVVSVGILWFVFMVMMNGRVFILRSIFFILFNGFLLLFGVCFLVVSRIIFLLMLGFVFLNKLIVFFNVWFIFLLFL